MPDYVFKDDAFGKVVSLDPPAAESTIAWSVLDAADFSIIKSAVQVDNEHSATTAAMTLLSSSGTSLPTGVSSAVRILKVIWQAVDTLVHQSVLVPFTVMNPVAVIISKDEIRALTGFNQAELSDDDLDLLGAAIQLRSLYGEGFVTPQMDSQRLLGLRAVLNLKPSLKMRVAESMSSDSVAFRRFRNLDLDAVFSDIEAEYDRILAALAPGQTAARTPATPDFFGVAARSPDPVTG